MKDLKGKNALLTGGSMGIGPHVARNLAREGVNIALTARSKDKLENVAEELRQLNVEVKTFPADIKNEKSRFEMVEEVKKAFGHIDLLINNAGVEWVSSFDDLTYDDIDNLIRTNLMSPLMLTRAVLPDMLKRKSGHIVTMSSLGITRIQMENPSGEE